MFHIFLYFSNPTPEPTDFLPVKWEPVTVEKLNYLSIDRDITAGVNPEHHRMQFWQKHTKTINKF